METLIKKITKIKGVSLKKRSSQFTFRATFKSELASIVGVREKQITFSSLNSSEEEIIKNLEMLKSNIATAEAMAKNKAMSITEKTNAIIKLLPELNLSVSEVTKNNKEEIIKDATSSYMSEVILRYEEYKKKHAETIITEGKRKENVTKLNIIMEIANNLLGKNVKMEDFNNQIMRDIRYTLTILPRKNLNWAIRQLKYSEYVKLDVENLDEKYREFGEDKILKSFDESWKYTPKSLKGYIIVLKEFMKYYVENDGDNGHPDYLVPVINSFKDIRNKKRIRKSFTAEQVNILIDGDTMFNKIARVYYYTGLRLAELAKATIKPNKDGIMIIKLDAKKIDPTLKAKNTNKGFKTSESERDVPYMGNPQDLIDVKEHITDRDVNILTPRYRGVAAKWNKDFRKLVNKYPDFDWDDTQVMYSLRKSFTSALQKADYRNMPVIDELLGHVPDDVTRQYYADGFSIDQKIDVLKSLLNSEEKTEEEKLVEIIKNSGLSTDKLIKLLKNA